MAATVESKKVWTEAELRALPEDGYLHEVVHGELVMSPKNSFYHGDICADLVMALRAFAKANKLGAAWDSSTGFWMKNRNCRARAVLWMASICCPASSIQSPICSRNGIGEGLDGSRTGGCSGHIVETRLNSSDTASGGRSTSNERTPQYVARPPDKSNTAPV